MRSVVHLITVALLLMMPQVTTLECYTCYSSKSWDDCLKVQIKHNCGAIAVENGIKEERLSVCAKVSRTKRRHNGQEENEYAKSCFFADQCSVEKCRRDDMKQYDATWCEIDCCRRSNCNTGGTTSFSSRAGKIHSSGAVIAFCVLVFLTIILE